MSTRGKFAVLAAVAISSAAFEPSADADAGASSAYCRKVRARAAADADILRAPRLVAEAIRFPASARVDLGPTVGEGFQVRGALAFSPTDAYRSFLLEDVGDADCRAHDVGDRIRGGLEGLSVIGRLPALRAQAAYLEAHRAQWRALLATSAQQLAGRLVTVVEYHELRQLTLKLEHKSVEVAGEIDRLEVAGAAVSSPAELEALTGAYVAASDAVERARANLQALDPWTFKLMGGIIPPIDGRSADWFGLAEISYSVGGLWRFRQDEKAVEARADEVRNARDELPARLADVERRLRAEVAATRRALRAVEAELKSTEETRAALDRSDAPNLGQARATLTVEHLAVESDRIFLQTLLETLDASVKEHDGG